MPKVAIIGGSGLFDCSLFKDAKLGLIKSKYGDVYVKVKEDLLFLQRHGKDNKTPPHLINHKANIHALQAVQVKKIFAVNSVGSLSKWIKPGSLIVPHDYISLQRVDTFREEYGVFMTPEVSEAVRQEIIAAAKRVGIKTKGKGIYWQTRAQRYETPAEINMIRNFADIVGMTMASEAQLAQEADIEYASLCTVDNYAHGITKQPLTDEQVVQGKQDNLENVEMVLKELLQRR